MKTAHLSRQLTTYFLLGVSLLGASAGAEQNTKSDWQYALCRGDNLWALSQTYLNAPNKWERLYKHNKLKLDVKRLPIGLKLQVPQSWTANKPVGTCLDRSKKLSRVNTTPDFLSMTIDQVFEAAVPRELLAPSLTLHRKAFQSGQLDVQLPPLEAGKSYLVRLMEESNGPQVAVQMISQTSEFYITLPPGKNPPYKLIAWIIPKAS